MHNGKKERFEDYDAFVEKFKPKKTTDDCYTPPAIYDAVLKYACGRFGIDEGKVVRPFYPGGDYRSFDYSGGRVVVDNPPFSILSEICKFYLTRGIPFFLFAPTLTCLSSGSVALRMNHLITSCHIIYENGARVPTSFVTSYGYPTVYESCPELTEIVNGVIKRLESEKSRDLPKYSYPDHVLTAAMGQIYAKRGIRFEVKLGECLLVSKLDSQRGSGGSIYGLGLLLSHEKAADKAAADKAAADKAAADKAAATVWQLSARELALIDQLKPLEADDA